jgi:predicted secreted Zn-dependent protease
MRRLPPSLFAMLLLAVCPVEAFGRDKFEIEYFRLNGATARELRADLSRKGPVGETGIRGDGYTEYRIAWKFSLTGKAGSCRADNIVVDLDVRMFLPQWDPPPGVSAELVRTWERFSSSLRDHEDGHHRLAIAAAQEVRRALRSRSKGRDCQSLKSRLNATAADVLRVYRGKQADFDRDTDFGRAQGNSLTGPDGR